VNRVFSGACRHSRQTNLQMNKWILLFVVTFGFLARAATFQSPLFDHHAWRQADSATMARNFYRDGISPWYPEIDARGTAERGYVATGLELHAIAFAAVSRLTGFSPFVGRLVSALCFPVSALFLWIFCRSRYDDTYALAAVFVYALCLPLVIYSERAIWNEPFLTMFSLAALAAAQRYLETERRTALFMLGLTLAAVAAIKPQWLVVLAPIAALWVERQRLKALRSPALWMVSIVACAGAAATLWHMQRVQALTHLSFGAADKLFHADDMSLHFGHVILRRLFRDLLGPLGLAAYVIGVSSCARHRRWAEPAGALGFLVYLVLVSRGNRIHDYYQLVIGPYAAITIPSGIFAAARAVAPRLPGAWTVERFATMTLWLMLLFAFGRSVSFHSWYDVDQEKVQFCSLLRAGLKTSDRVAFADYNSPDILFCLDRRGWLTSTTEMSPAEAGLLRDSGAAVLAMPRASERRLGGLGETVASTTNWLAIRFK
jgi:hypothetical protein